MDTFNQAFGLLLRGYSAALAWAPAGVRLAILSALAGIAMLWVFRKTSDQARMRAVKRRVQAYLLELRIFGDEPSVMWRSQKALFAANARYIGLMMRPALFLGLPMALLLIHLEAFYGRAPLPVGREAIVTMAVRDPLASTPVLLPAPGIAIETPPVRVVDRGEVSWRIRPTAEFSGRLRFVVDGRTIEKRIEAGAGPRYAPGRRTGSVLESVWRPDEPHISSAGVEWIDVRYPEAEVSLFGLRLNWLVWFFVISMLAALALRKRFRVAL
jgi:hypothetical protein